ncbi:MAG: NAD(+) synthase [Candidatus Taylorbacteria bacterium]|nr:NAD(+) synthase [Candidatus Taylorbacteria bacterium]
MDKNLEGLKISLCQMPVVPGRPDLNAEYIIKEIKSAFEREVDIIAFPEMCVTGYLVGDVFEDEAFIEDVSYWNKKIIDSVPEGITAIFGTVISSSDEKGEDGRKRLHNGAIVINRRMLDSTFKTLQPNYRFFNDDKHFYSMRKVAEEKELLIKKLKTFIIPASGRVVRIGVILCEDMWHQDYAFNPTKILVEKGAQIIFNLSASPWTWKKNDKRHRVVKELLTECKVPFVYVNNTGTQNTGKNIITFDGSSTLYDERGDIVFEVPPYSEGGHDFMLSRTMKPVVPRQSDDTSELYAAMVCATKSMVGPDTKVVIGLSGGIDSAVSAAHFVDVLGPEQVVAVNMPFLNSQETQDTAKTIVQNLGVESRVIPIDKVVSPILHATGVEWGTLAFQNVQARVRMEILAAIAQQIGGRFVCNSNKVEVAFGYGTLYGDIAGFYAPLGDLVKREIRQIADYINKERFKREVIPESCIGQIPSAELTDLLKDQHDPFDYGYRDKRGYHDEMVRAFTEFRKNPEWFLDMYIQDKLEEELKLETGTLKRLFPTNGTFIEDLEKQWRALYRSFFKRVQCPPIPIFSKRAFGLDFEESMMSPHFTERYKELRKTLLNRS